MSEKTIYRLNDDISFRKCSLFDEDALTFGDCTNFHTIEEAGEHITVVIRMEFIFTVRSTQKSNLNVIALDMVQ